MTWFSFFYTVTRYRLSRRDLFGCGFPILLTAVSIVALIVVTVLIVVFIENSTNMFQLRPAVALLGSINPQKYDSIDITTEDTLSDNTQIWLADEESFFSQKSISEPQVLSNYSGTNIVYAMPGSNFTYEFFNVVGPPGSIYRVYVFEDGNISNTVCSMNLTAQDSEASFTCIIEETNYYNIQFVLDDGITGEFQQYFTIIGLNATFYTSSSYPSCNLNSTSRHCSFSVSHLGKDRYLIAFSIHDEMLLLITYHGRYDWYAFNLLPAIVLVCFILYGAVRVISCCCICKKRKECPKWHEIMEPCPC